MGVYLAAILVGVPGIIFLIYCYTPKGKEWRRMNGPHRERLYPPKLPRRSPGGIRFVAV